MKLIGDVQPTLFVQLENLVSGCLGAVCRNATGTSRAVRYAYGPCCAPRVRYVSYGTCTPQPKANEPPAAMAPLVRGIMRTIRYERMH